MRFSVRLEGSKTKRLPVRRINQSPVVRYRAVFPFFLGGKEPLEVQDIY